MSKLNLMRNPIARKKNGTKISCIPDLAREISEQDLTSVSGGTATPITASITVSIIVASMVTNIATAAQSRKPDSSGWHPDC